MPYLYSTSRCLKKASVLSEPHMKQACTGIFGHGGSSRRGGGESCPWLTSATSLGAVVTRPRAAPRFDPTLLVKAGDYRVTEGIRGCHLASSRACSALTRFFSASLPPTATPISAALQPVRRDARSLEGAPFTASRRSLHGFTALPSRFKGAPFTASQHSRSRHHGGPLRSAFQGHGAPHHRAAIHAFASDTESFPPDHLLPPSLPPSKQRCAPRDLQTEGLGLRPSKRANAALPTARSHRNPSVGFPFCEVTK